MILLVDTHLLLRAAGEPQRLSSEARRLLEDPGAQLWFSAASLWEIAIKASRGREDFTADAEAIRDTLEDNGFDELPVTAQHAVALTRLPAIHGDPFDRMLIAQAIVEPMALITTDERLATYPGTIEVV